MWRWRRLCSARKRNASALCIATAALPDEEDRAFMSRLWRQYHRLMFFIARRYASEPSVLEDIVSESCLRLMERVDTLTGLAEGQLRAYIRSTVRSRAVDLLRRRRRETAVGDGDGPAFESPDPDWQRIELREELERVLEAVSRLPEPQRTALRLKYGENRTDAEIAAALGVARSTASKYLFTARRTLKEKLYGEGEER